MTAERDRLFERLAQVEQREKDVRVAHLALHREGSLMLWRCRCLALWAMYSPLCGRSAVIEMVMPLESE
jgi:hypothetical protein